MPGVGRNLGIHGRNVLGQREIAPGKGHVNMRGAMLSANTNVHPAFGMDYKIHRNRAVVGSVIAQTWGLHAIKKGPWVFGDVQEKLSDPLHRDPLLILMRARQESSIAGRSRAFIRPAAPQQVTWKNQYWVLQRTRGRRGTTIGPYGKTSGMLVQQSVLSRIGDFLTGQGAYSQ